jgi:hypothetical protein
VTAPVPARAPARVGSVKPTLLAAQVRERNFNTEWNVRASVEYAPERRLEWAGFVVISCQTSPGMVEFAGPRPDVPLMLHVLRGEHSQAQQATGGEQA